MTPEQFHTELGYRMAFDDIMDIMNDMLEEDKVSVNEFWNRIQNQFEIRKIDGFTLSEPLAKIVNSKP